VHHTDRGVAVAYVLDQDPHPDQVVDVVEVPTTNDHLLVDGVVVFGTALDSGADPGAGQLRGHLTDYRAQVGVPGGGPVRNQPHDLVVLLRVQDREGEVLQLPLDGRHAEAMRQRSEYLEGLLRLAGLLLRRQETHGAHVVQPVRKLDHQHPRVAGHRDDHLPDGLGFCGGAELDLVQLGDTVDQVCDLIAEVLAEPGQ
jgi:hypothetical protein